MTGQCEVNNIDAKGITDGWGGMDNAQLLTIKQFSVLFPWPSEAALRAYIYRANELGISDAFVRVGRRVLVAPSKFFRLIKQLDSRSNQGGSYETASHGKGKNYV